MLLVPDGNHRTGGKERSAMNAFAVFAVNSHIETLIEEAADRRAAEPKPGLRQRVVAFRDALRDAIEDAAETAPRLIHPTGTNPFAI